jgi:hypothetical protein
MTVPTKQFCRTSWSDQARLARRGRPLRFARGPIAGQAWKGSREIDFRPMRVSADSDWIARSRHSASARAPRDPRVLIQEIVM